MMKLKLVISVFVILLISSCKTTQSGSSDPKENDGRSRDYGSPKTELKLFSENVFLITQQTNDSTYGYTVDNPIMVGSQGGSGPLNERRYLNALAGPNGEDISYYRIGSCCPFKTQNSAFEAGMLDKYSVQIKGQKKEIILYINMYDSKHLKIPVGFTSRF